MLHLLKLSLPAIASSLLIAACGGSSAEHWQLLGRILERWRRLRLLSRPVDMRHSAPWA